MFVANFSSVLLLFENLNSHVVDGCVVEHDDASVGTGFDVNAAVFAELIVAAAEIVANGLNSYVEFIGYLMCGTVGQAVFEPAEFVESDCLSHIVIGFMG